MNRFDFVHNDRKNGLLKKKIISFCINDEDNSIAEISRKLNCSIPTVTKLTNELINDGLLTEKGKQETNGGRRPVIYGLDPDAGQFIGVDIRQNHICLASMKFDGTINDYVEDIPFKLECSENSLQELCRIVLEQLEEAGIDQRKVIAYGVNLTGRVNTESGYSYSFFLGEDKPIAELMQEELSKPVYIENDSRAMTYGEYVNCYSNVKDLLFINMTWGVGMGMIMDNKLFYGKSGFSGEIGHFPMLDNDRICQCGKVGCLETEASGFALQRMMMEKMDSGHPSILSERYGQKKAISMEDMLEAIQEEDVLAIECIEQVGRTLGRAIAGLINLFNPELVIIGGNLSLAKDYLLIPVRGAVNKHSLNLVNKDTRIVCSKLGKKAGPVGACHLSRSKILGMM